MLTANDLTAFISKYSDPFIQKSVYDSDYSNKSELLWLLLKEKHIGKYAYKYVDKLIKDLELTVHERYFEVMMTRKTLYEDYFYIFENIRENTQAFFEKLEKKIPERTIITIDAKKIEAELKIERERTLKLSIDLAVKEKEYEFGLIKQKDTLNRQAKEIQDYYIECDRLKHFERKYENIKIDFLKLKEEFEKKFLIMSQTIHEKSQERDTYDTRTVVLTTGIKDLEDKLQTFLEENNTLKNKNKELKDQYEEIIKQLKTKTKEIKRNAQFLNEQYVNIMSEYNSKSKNVVDLYMYIFL